MYFGRWSLSKPGGPLGEAHEQHKRNQLPNGQCLKLTCILHVTVCYGLSSKNSGVEALTRVTQNMATFANRVFEEMLEFIRVGPNPMSDVFVRGGNLGTNACRRKAIATNQ